MWDIDKDCLITALPSEIVLPMLQQLEAIDLCRLGQVSKRMLVFAEDDSIWQGISVT